VKNYPLSSEAPAKARLVAMKCRCRSPIRKLVHDGCGAECSATAYQSGEETARNPTFRADGRNEDRCPGGRSQISSRKRILRLRRMLSPEAATRRGLWSVERRRRDDDGRWWEYDWDRGYGDAGRPENRGEWRHGRSCPRMLMHRRMAVLRHLRAAGSDCKENQRRLHPQRLAQL
jgi:hypothetical protein